MKIIDVSAGVGFWPTQLFSSHSLDDLEKVFSRTGVEEVWLSAIESILYPEPDTFDLRLFAQLPSFPRFRAVKTVNPLLTNWEKSLRSAAKAHSLVALKIFPNYHGYAVTSAQLAPVCRVAAELQLPILASIRVNDVRNQPVSMQVPDVAADELCALSLAFPDTVIVAQCAFIHELPQLANGSDNLLADTAFLDGEGVMADAIKTFPGDRLVFGSHEAFAHVEASLLKLRHARIPEAVKTDIAAGNIESRSVR